jgi:hypothetical protein
MRAAGLVEKMGRLSLDKQHTYGTMNYVRNISIHPT